MLNNVITTLSETVTDVKRFFSNDKIYLIPNVSSETIDTFTKTLSGAFNPKFVPSYVIGDLKIDDGIKVAAEVENTPVTEVKVIEGEVIQAAGIGGNSMSSIHEEFSKENLDELKALMALHLEHESEDECY